MNSTYSSRAAGEASYGFVALLVRCFCTSMVLLTAAYLINNYFVVWRDWPGATGVYLGLSAQADLGWRGWLQGFSYPLMLVAAVAVTLRFRHRSLTADAELWDATAAYIVRTAFWGVCLIGLADGIISFLRVEGLLSAVVGNSLAGDLGRAAFRGTFVHYPLLLIAMVVAAFVKRISVSWLALLVVLAEFLIVVARFIFSYEQTFMGDLVRFWYAALFLFASAYTLREEGHVRVDVLYSHLNPYIQSRLNIAGILLLGLPLCWVILLLGMWDSTSSLNSPLAGFEISQSGYGLYVKYLMAGFLIIFAVTMLVQFCSYLLTNLSILTGEKIPEVHSDDSHPPFTDKV